MLVLELICELAEPIIEVFGPDIWRFVADLFAGARSPSHLG